MYDQTTNTLTSERVPDPSDTDPSDGIRTVTTTYTYDVYNHLETMTLPDPDGDPNSGMPAPVWTYDYCTCGKLMSIIGPDPDGDPNSGLAAPVWTYSYNSTTEKLESVTGPDPDGVGIGLPRPVTTYDYDSNGRLWKVTEPGNRVTVYEYGIDGQVTKITLPDPDPNDMVAAPEWDYAYDVLGRLDTVTDPNGKATTYTYDALGQLKTSTDPTGYVSTYFYTADGRPQQVGAPKDGATLALPGPLTTFTYDDAGRLTVVADPLSHETTYGYDDFGRLETVTSPDPDGPGTGTLDPLETTYTYDENGRVLTETTNGQTTTYEYSDAGNVTKVTNPDPDGAATEAPIIVAGQGSGTDSATLVRVLEADNTLRFEIDPYADPNGGSRIFSGEIRVAAGDVNGDGVGDIIVAPGAGSFTTGAGVNQIRIYDGRDGTFLAQFDAYSGYTGGLFVAAGDVNGDGIDEILVSHQTIVAGQSNFKVFDALTGRLFSQVFVFATNYTGGVRLAVGDVDGDGKDEAIVTQSSGYQPAVRVYNALTGVYTQSWYGDDNGVGGYTGGLYVAAGDVDGDGKDEVIVGRGTGDGQIHIFNAESSTAIANSATQFPEFTAFPGNSNGVRVGAADVNADGVKDILVGMASGTSAWRAYEPDSTVLVAELAYDAGDITGGLFIAGGVGAADAPAAETEYVYDAWGRVTQMIEGFVGAFDWQKHVTTFTYDALGNRTSLEDASGNLTQWIYDGLSRLIQEIDPRGHSTYFTYDSNGDLATKTDGDGRVTEYDFDGLHRLIEERWLDATQSAIETIDYTYDLMNRLLTATDDDSSLTYTYDDAGRLLTVSNDGVTVPLTVLTSTYDDLGNRDSLSAVIGTTADFTNDYLYDALGRMTQIMQHDTTGNTVADKRVDLAYDALNRFTSIDRYADLGGTELVATTDYTYDNSGRLTGISHADGSSTSLANYTYGYDFANRLTSFVSDTDSVLYFYDPFGQLRFEDHTGQDDHTYPYDATGNRVAADGPADTGNLVVEDATYQYQYDNEGNLEKKTTKTTGDYTLYTWDYHNQLTRVELYDSSDNLTSSVTYDYDAMGRLIRRVVDGDGITTFDSTQKFVYDGTEVVLVFDDTNAVTDRMLWGPATDQLFAQENDLNEVLWTLTDNLGSVRQVVEYDGTNGTTVADTLDYDAFGNVTSESTPANSPLFKFTGRYFDDVTGLQYNWHRWYDPAAGRWISQDPIGFDGGDVNLLRYVSNSPNAIDPTGLKGWVWPWDRNASWNPRRTYNLWSNAGYLDINCGAGIGGGVQIGKTPPGWKGPKLPFIPDVHPYVGIQTPGFSVNVAPGQSVSSGLGGGFGGYIPWYVPAGAQVGAAGGFGTAFGIPEPFWEVGVGTPGGGAGCWWTF